MNWRERTSAIGAESWSAIVDGVPFPLDAAISDSTDDQRACLVVDKRGDVTGHLLLVKPGGQGNLIDISDWTPVEFGMAVAALPLKLSDQLCTLFNEVHRRLRLKEELSYAIN